MEKNDIPMIPKHQAEAAMMHISRVIRCIVAIVIAFSITIAVCVYIFVAGYTSRTKDWLNTFNNLLRIPAVTEAINEEEAAGIIQQLPLP